MDSRLIPNLIDVSLCLVALFISVRSFDVYAQFRQLRLFILGLSMALVSLSAAADFTASYVRVVTLNTDWFLYIGQAVGFLFILLSLMRNSENYLRVLMRLNIVAFPLLLLLLLLSPVLPGIPNAVERAVLGGSRCLICFMIFFAYFAAFTSKPTRFSLLMSASFFLLSAGYLMTLEQSFAPSLTQYLFNDLGDITGVIGLVALVAAVSWE
jgi:hypothetical protein